MKNGVWGYRYQVLVNGKMVWKRVSKDEDEKPLRTKTQTAKVRKKDLQFGYIEVQQAFPRESVIHESKYTGKEPHDVQGDEQFEIDDNCSLDKMYQDIAEEGLQPVLNCTVIVRMSQNLFRYCKKITSFFAAQIDFEECV